MDTRQLLIKPASIYFLIILVGGLILTACGKSISPTGSATLPPITNSTLEQPSDMPPPSQPILASPTPKCTDDLRFVADVTIPDDTEVTPGSLLDKQWSVQNNGNCNWDARYRLRLVSGDAMGALPEQALFPARAGTQANLRILFTAPQQGGDYFSEWQAFDPGGVQFGESFVIKITVQQ